MVDQSARMSNDTILEVQFNINASFPNLVLKIVWSICAKLDEWSENNKFKFGKQYKFRGGVITIDKSLYLQMQFLNN